MLFRPRRWPLFGGSLGPNKRWHPNRRLLLTARQQYEHNLANGFNFVPADSSMEDVFDVLGFVHVDGQRFMPREVFLAWAEQRAAIEERAQWRPVGWL